MWQEGGRQEPPDIAFGTLCPQATPAAEPTDSPTRAAEPEPIPDTTRTEDLATPAPASLATKPTSRRSDADHVDDRRPRRPRPAPSTDPTTDPATHLAGAVVDATRPPSDDDDGGGPPLAGLAIGTVLVAVLGGAALARSRRTGGSP